MSEEDHLAQADQHIAETEARIARQHELVALFAGETAGLRQAENRLRGMRQSLELMRQHRAAIVRELAAKGP